VHHVGILYDQFMMHGQRNIKLWQPHFIGYQITCNYTHTHTQKSDRNPLD